MEYEYEERNDSGIGSRALTDSADERTPTPSNYASKFKTIFSGKLQCKVQKKSNRGRIVVSIGNCPPALSSSTLFCSEPIQIGGLHWRLQIIHNRNPLTGQSRFISLFIICEDVPIGEILTTLIKFRLISQIDDSCGEEEEIFGKFDRIRRHAGISNFYEFGMIFKEGSEFLCERSNEAQIEAQICIISREREHICRIDRLLLYPFQHFGQSKLSIWPQKRLKFASDFLQRDDEEMEEEGDENEMGQNDNESSKMEINCENEHDGKIAIGEHWAKRRKRRNSGRNANGGGDGSNITDYFPCRRSSRIPSKTILHSNLEIQVKTSANEHLLEIFKTTNKGRGLRTKKEFKKGEFVVEYKGEVLNMENAKKRELVYAKNSKIGCYMFFFKHIDTNWCIDATKECASKGRLVNHSKLVPNMKAKVFDLGDEYPHLCLIAMRDIQIDEELTFDYGDRTPLIVEKNPWLLNT